MLRIALGVAASMLAGELVAQPAPERAHRDSVEAARYIAHVRREEAKFFNDWRHEWFKLRDLKGTDPRYWSLHCHYDDFEADDEYHIVLTTSSRKSMCPIWFQGQGIRGDENVNIDNAIPPKSRAKIHEKRARIIAMLDTAFRRAPGNAWVTTQRVRLFVDQQEYDQALQVATNECAISIAICAMFEGYVHTSRGFARGGEAMYALAAGSMTPIERCGFLDISLLIGDNSRERDAYRELSCAARGAIDATYWWLSDPLFLQPSNERLAAHLHRETILMLHAALTADEHFDYRPAKGGLAVVEMITRYGWPSVEFHDTMEDENHYGWLRWKDSAANSSREYLAPRYHTAPSYAEVLDLRLIDGRSFRDLSPRWIPEKLSYDPAWWPFEHFEHPAPLTELDFQAAGFRRSGGPLFVVAMDGRHTVDTLPLAGYINGIGAMRNPTDRLYPRSHPAVREATGAFIASADLNPGLQIVSAEILDPENDKRPAFRSRFAVDAPPGLDSLKAGEIALSDVAFYAAPPPGDTLPRIVGDALELLLPTTDLKSPGRVGVFFELYGAQTSAAIELTLTVSRIDKPSLLRRLGSRIGVVESGTGSVVMRWRDDQQGAMTTTFKVGQTPVQARSVVVDMAALKSGMYAFEIGASRPGETGAISRREFTISR